MDEKTKAYKEMNKKKHEVDEKLTELEMAKNNYFDSILASTIKDIITVFNDEGKITERDLKIYLTDLANDVKNVYYR